MNNSNTITTKSNNNNNNSNTNNASSIENTGNASNAYNTNNSITSNSAKNNSVMVIGSNGFYRFPPLFVSSVGSCIVDSQDIDIATLASELAEFDWKLFSRIRMAEYMDKAWRHKYKEILAPNIVATISWFNHVSFWVASEILKNNNPKQRADFLSRFIQLAASCFELRDYHAVFAIVGGLNMGCIHRLKATWENVPKKKREQFSGLTAFILGDKGEMVAYKNELKNASLPAVPYLGVLLHDITFIFDKSEVTKFPIVFSHKIEVMALLFAQAHKFQRVGYPPTKQLYINQLRNAKVMENATLYRKSLELEPRTS